jgi:hypothetical protein
MEISKGHWARVVDAAFDHLAQMCSNDPGTTMESDDPVTPTESDVPVTPTESNVLPNTIRRAKLQGEECIWLLNTLSCLHSARWERQEKFCVIDIFLAVCSSQAPHWYCDSGPDVLILEAGLTLVAISRSSDRAYRLEILNNSRIHPWLLPNLRNLELIRGLVEDTRQDTRSSSSPFFSQSSMPSYYEARKP